MAEAQERSIEKKTIGGEATTGRQNHCSQPRISFILYIMVGSQSDGKRLKGRKGRKGDG
jgi:hypothetical protein